MKGIVIFGHITLPNIIDTGKFWSIYSLGRLYS